MKNEIRAGTASAAFVLSLVTPSVFAQDAGTPSSGAAPATPRAPAASAQSPGGMASDPNPYYVGFSQGLTHDSNVYRISGGASDTYSTTSLLGGFNQRFGRQRVFGSANVADNRYFSQDQLNNVSYGIAAGIDWETINSLSGNVNVGLNRNLSAPITTASTAQRNIATTESVDARARWGGASILTLEGALGYSQIKYSAPQSAVSNSSPDSGGLTLFYRPGGPLRLGLGGHVTRTKSPDALLDPVTGQSQSNTVDGRNLDFLADYDLSGLLSFNGRLSYTKQTNSGIANADFSGLTGSAALVYHVTGKTTLNAQVAREAGFDSSFFNSYAAVQTGRSLVLTPVSVLYENNRVTDSIGVGAAYAATAKIGVNVGARYSRAKLATAAVSTSGTQSVPETTDSLRTAYLGANYAITRNISAACNLSHESRSVSGGISFSYTATAFGCSAQVLWP